MEGYYSIGPFLSTDCLEIPQSKLSKIIGDILNRHQQPMMQQGYPQQYQQPMMQQGYQQPYPQQYQQPMMQQQSMMQQGYPNQAYAPMQAVPMPPGYMG